MRLCVRLGLFAGIAFALFKLVQGRRAASELGRPSPDWATPPAPQPSNVPKSPPDPELVKPAMLEEVIEKKAAERTAPPDAAPAPPAGSAARAERAAPAKKAAPAKRAAAKKAPAPAADPVKKAPAAKKAPAKKATLPVRAPETAPVAKKAAPVKKAPKKQG
jgi:hypothetical protein